MYGSVPGMDPDKVSSTIQISGDILTPVPQFQHERKRNCVSYGAAVLLIVAVFSLLVANSDFKGLILLDASKTELSKKHKPPSKTTNSTSDTISGSLTNTSNSNFQKINATFVNVVEGSVYDDVGSSDFEQINATFVNVVQGSIYDDDQSNEDWINASIVLIPNDDIVHEGILTDDAITLDEWLQMTTVNSKPHVVFVLADDLGWNSIGYKDFDLSFATPFLTSLAKDGIIMDNYYAQEMCSPSRASMLTGRYPISVGMQYHMVEETIGSGLSLNETTFVEIFQQNGYSTHMVGKWDLGHYSPRHLPTARGFDSFTGYLNGENYYWSKRNPFYSNFVDMLSANSTCYTPYEEDDLHTYSTYFYRDKAISIINEHDASESSLLLYVSLQAVHNPFSDVDKFSNGVPKEYMDADIYEQIRTDVAGHNRRQYAMALNLVDGAMSDIYDALEAKGLMSTTLLIFASDNGGCFEAGGKNGPLRGTKGSLFEGGTKVDAFLYSALLPSKLHGTLFTGLMHVSDWFPTLMHLVGIDYTEPEGFELDGKSQLAGWFGDGPQRDFMVYNFYANVEGYDFDMWTNGSFAVRNYRYKLMHMYNSTVYGGWWAPEDILEADDAIDSGSCSQEQAATGSFTFALFDLQVDPYETDNLYDSSATMHVEAKESLYQYAELVRNTARSVNMLPASSRMAQQVWKEHGDYMVPWVRDEDIEGLDSTTMVKAYPQDCFAMR